MEERLYSDYKTHLDKLIQRTLFSYPFYDKTDEELISDAKERTKNGIEFGLFKLRERDIKTVIVHGEIVGSKILPLISTLDESAKPIEIKISSFMYPSYFLSSLLDKKETMRSTLDYKTYNDYGRFYRAIEEYYGDTILVTSCWETMSDFGTIVKCVNIMPTPDNDSSLARLISECLIKERRSFICDILEKPYKYIPSYPVNNDILNEIFKEYKPKFEEELVRLNDYR